MQNTERQDVYTRITGKIIASLEQGVTLPITLPFGKVMVSTFCRYVLGWPH
jgi:antirestriction protein ArdC